MYVSTYVSTSRQHQLLRLVWWYRGEGGEGDWRGQGQAVVVRAGELVDHGVNHSLSFSLCLDGRTEAQLGAFRQVGVAGGGVWREKIVSWLT